MSDALRAELARVAARLGADGVEFVLERPRDAGHGDLATNLAMVLARQRARQSAEDRGAGARGACASPPSSWPVPRSPGPDSSTSGWPRTSSPRPTGRILDAGPGVRALDLAAPALKVNVEFVSANPTGPLHVGHGRGRGAGRRASPPCSNGPVTRSPASSTSTMPVSRSTSWPQSLWARVREAAGRPADDPRGRLPRRVPPGERPRGARA